MAETPKDVFLNSLTFDGSDGLKVEVAGNITGATLKRTTDGVSTLTIELYDGPSKNLLRSNIVNSRITAQVDGRSFSAVALNKQGESLSWTFEDLAVAEMRKHNAPRKFAAGSVTRVQAARILLEEDGLNWVPIAVGVNDNVPIKVELARGQLTAIAKDSSMPTVDENYFTDGSSSSATGQKQTQVKDEDREDTWTAIKRWFGEINWNCYVDDGVLNIGPQSAYTAGDPAFRVTDGLPSLTSFVDFDWDIGKPLATADYKVCTDAFAAAPGTCIELYDLGPANGKWFISESSRDLFSVESEITVQVPEPVLPEPDDPSDSGQNGVDDNYFGASSGSDDINDLLKNLQDAVSGVGSGAAGGKWAWPVNGSHKINSGFGAKESIRSKPHKGLDIAATEGQGIFATRAGVVNYVGFDSSGYGNWVAITHSEAAATGPYLAGDRPPAKSRESRYGHLSRIAVAKGVQVFQGQLIGFAGHTGDATGPHLHFELRETPDGNVVDPFPILTGLKDF